METGKFFDGVTAESSESELRRIARRHPVFKMLRHSGTVPRRDAA